MSLELTALPLAFLAGILGILSPCVWPLVPVVIGSAATGGRGGPYALAFGLSLSFALAGSLLSFLLVSTGMDPELFRYVAALILLAAGLVLVVKPLGDWLNLKLSRLSSRFNMEGEGGAFGQFGVGFLLGLVWLPCVGPTLGAAIALASMGQQLATAFLVMLVFGLGTASMLLAAGLLSGRLLKRCNAAIMGGARRGRLLLGAMLLLLGMFVLTGFDKVLQARALEILPEWSTSL